MERFKVMMRSRAKRVLFCLSCFSATDRARLRRKLPSFETDVSQQHIDDNAKSTKLDEDAPSQKKVARGEWLCYCFVEGEPRSDSQDMISRFDQATSSTFHHPLAVSLDTSLSTLIQESHDYLQGKLGTQPSLQDLRCRASTTAAPEFGQGGSGNTATTSADCLHISLTRPFTVRSYERDEYVKVASAEVKRLRTEIGR